MSHEPSDSALLPVPRWLTRAEKADFRRIEGRRKAVGEPVSEAEVDAVADLVSLRSRIADIRKVYRLARNQARSCPLNLADRASFLAVARQLDTATANAQRQARRLGLGSPTTEKTDDA
jgi:hypothetical protein